VIDKRCEVMHHKETWPYIQRCSNPGRNFVRPPDGVEEDDLWCCAADTLRALDERATIVDGPVRRAVMETASFILAIKRLRELDEKMGLADAKHALDSWIEEHGRPPHWMGRY
jgi:hypothetical protein